MAESQTGEKSPPDLRPGRRLASRQSPSRISVRGILGRRNRYARGTSGRNAVATVPTGQTLRARKTERAPAFLRTPVPVAEKIASTNHLLKTNSLVLISAQRMFS